MYDGFSIAKKFGISNDTFFRRGVEVKIKGDETKYVLFLDSRHTKSIKVHFLEAIQFETEIKTQNPKLMILLSKYINKN